MFWLQMKLSPYILASEKKLTRHSQKSHDWTGAIDKTQGRGEKGETPAHRG